MILKIIWYNASEHVFHIVTILWLWYHVTKLDRGHEREKKDTQIIKKIVLKMRNHVYMKELHQLHRYQVSN